MHAVVHRERGRHPVRVGGQGGDGHAAVLGAGAAEQLDGVQTAVGGLRRLNDNFGQERLRFNRSYA